MSKNLADAIDDQDDIVDIKRLIDQGCDVNEINTRGFSPLDMALYDRRDNVSQLLLKHNAVIDIFAAASLGRIEIVKQIVERHPFIITDMKGIYSPLGWALLRDQAEVVGYLVVKRDYFGSDSANGLGAIHEAGRYGAVKSAKLLKRIGIDVNRDDRWGNTALHYAAESKEGGITQTLLDLGCDADHENHLHETPLVWSANLGNLDGMRALLRRAAATEQKGKAVLAASEAGQTKALQLLLQNGGSVDSVRKDGSCALSLAVFRGHLVPQR